MTTILIIFILLILLFFWNNYLILYRDRNIEKLVSDESSCFSERCKSIIKKHEGGRKAVLMIHGFPTTPSMYDYASKRAFEAGYDVHAPLIPTFGADISKFEQTDFTEWFSFISDYFEELRGRYQYLAVLGVSMGGAMTLKIGEKYSGTLLAPDKLVVISAPVVYNSFRYGIITSPLFPFARTIALFKSSINPHIVDGIPDGEDGNEDWTGYGGTFIRQGLSLAKAFDYIRRDLGKIQIPMFVMHERRDKTVPFRNVKIIEKYCTDQIEVLREVAMEGEYNHTYHSLLMYHSVQQQYMDEILAFLDGKKSKS